MKKFIIYIVVFFAIVATVDFVFGKACDYLTTHAKSGGAKQLIDLCKKDHYDMLVMGSSKAHHNYIPQVFTDSLGLSCYNAGYDGNGIILAYAILSMIDDDLLPKLIVYDVKQQFDIYHYSGDGDYSRYLHLLKKFYHRPEIAQIIRGISRLGLFKLQSGLVRYNGELYNVVSGFLRSSSINNRFGYVPVVGTISEEVEQERDFTNQIDVLKMGYFKKYITLVKEKNVSLVVVLSPELYSSELYDFQPIIDLCAEERIPVVDYYNSPMFQIKDYFKDHCHMNEEGARAFSSEMASYLARIIND